MKIQDLTVSLHAFARYESPKQLSPEFSKKVNRVLEAYLASFADPKLAKTNKINDMELYRLI